MFGRLAIVGAAVALTACVTPVAAPPQATEDAAVPESSNVLDVYRGRVDGRIWLACVDFKLGAHHECWIYGGDPPQPAPTGAETPPAEQQ